MLCSFVFHPIGTQPLLRNESLYLLAELPGDGEAVTISGGDG